MVLDTMTLEELIREIKTDFSEVKGRWKVLSASRNLSDKQILIVTVYKLQPCDLLITLIFHSFPEFSGRKTRAPTLYRAEAVRHSKSQKRRSSLKSI